MLNNFGFFILKHLYNKADYFWGLILTLVNSVSLLSLAAVTLTLPDSMLDKIFCYVRYVENLIDYMDTIADILGQDASYNQVIQ